MTRLQFVDRRIWLLALAISFVTAQSTLGQIIPPNADVFEKEGTVGGVAQGMLQLIAKDNTPWVLQIVPKQTTVKIEGEAEPGFLHTGLFVRFTGEIDAKGVLQGDVKELEIVSPTGKNSTGVFPVGSGDTGKAVNKLEAGTYEIRGRVGTYKDGEILVTAGKKITGKIAPDAKVKVNASDLSFAQVDDVVTSRGWTTAAMAPDGNKGRPGQAVATDISIKLAKPLAAIVTKKGPTKPARTPKAKAGADEPAVNTEDPFGLNKAADKKK